jgi:hypothetical protein
MVGIESADREHECNARQRNASGQRRKCLQFHHRSDSGVDFSA